MVQEGPEPLRDRIQGSGEVYLDPQVCITRVLLFSEVDKEQPKIFYVNLRTDVLTVDFAKSIVWRVVQQPKMQRSLRTLAALPVHPRPRPLCISPFQNTPPHAASLPTGSF